MKRIGYIKRGKIATDQAERYRLQSTDLDQILQTAKFILQIIETLRLYNETELYSELTAARSDLPKKTQKFGYGKNSIQSMCSGLVANFSQGQFDLSAKTARGIETCINETSRLTQLIDEIEFIEVPKLGHRLIELHSIGSTYMDFFETA